MSVKPGQAPHLSEGNLKQLTQPPSTTPEPTEEVTPQPETASPDNTDPHGDGNDTTRLDGVSHQATPDSVNAN